jgi:uncharacterized protein YbbK (DUF523 family)
MNNEKEKVLISACLLGEKCRYDGLAKEVKGIINLTKYYDLIPVCPEVSGGLKTPRTPSEIKDNKVISKTGKDVTENYLNGAYWASSICNIYHIKLAILKEDSPSCGSHFIHDGSFSGKKIPGKGMTTRKLEKQGIKVINEEEALALLKQLESKGK